MGVEPSHRESSPAGSPSDPAGVTGPIPLGWTAPSQTLLLALAGIRSLQHEMRVESIAPISSLARPSFSNPPAGHSRRRDRPVLPAVRLTLSDGPRSVAWLISMGPIRTEVLERKPAR